MRMLRSTAIRAALTRDTCPVTQAIITHGCQNSTGSAFRCHRTANCVDDLVWLVPHLAASTSTPILADERMTNSRAVDALRGTKSWHRPRPCATLKTLPTKGRISIVAELTLRPIGIGFVAQFTATALMAIAPEKRIMLSGGNASVLVERTAEHIASYNDSGNTAMLTAGAISALLLRLACGHDEPIRTQIV